MAREILLGERSRYGVSHTMVESVNKRIKAFIFVESERLGEERVFVY